MQAAQKLFLLAWTIVIIIVSTIMGLIAVSLVPHFGEIGNVATWALFIILGCGVSLIVAFTWYKIKSMRIQSQVLTHGEVMVFRKRDGTFEHLSAQHVRAGVPLPAAVTVKELPSPDPRWDAVLDLRKDGKGMHAIAKELKVPYNRVRTFLNQVEGNDDEM